MKKLLLAAVCCLTLSYGSAMAQNDNNGRGMRGGMRGGVELVADTAITNHMELSAEQLKQIDEINANYRNSMKQMMTQRSEDGRRMSHEDRQTMMEKIKAQKKEARQQLRTVLGDDLYIEYLETALDRMPHMMMGGANGSHGGMRGGQGMGGGQRGGQGMGGGRSRGGYGGFGGGDGDDF